MGIRLVVADLDGTLLDGSKELPEQFWDVHAGLRKHGIRFVPASGRQYATLRTLFHDISDGMPFIAENGTYVVCDDEEISSTVLKPDFVREVVTFLRGIYSSHDIGVVVCGKRSAKIERTDDAFVDEASQYYAQLDQVDDVLRDTDDVVKIAIYDFAEAESSTAPLLDRFRDGHQVVVSGKHWIDIMDASANKGRAIAALQKRFGISPDETMVFGDYLNDLDMFDVADHSYAVANAHPDVLKRATNTAPANTEGGVISILRDLIS